MIAGFIFISKHIMANKKLIIKNNVKLIISFSNIENNKAQGRNNNKPINKVKNRVWCFML